MLSSDDAARLRELSSLVEREAGIYRHRFRAGKR
jgi:hypothetical protein